MCKNLGWNVIIGIAKLHLSDAGVVENDPPGRLVEDHLEITWKSPQNNYQSPITDKYLRRIYPHQMLLFLFLFGLGKN